MRDRWPEGAWLAEFEDPLRLIEAVRAVRDAGGRDIEYYAPYPVRELEPLLGYSRGWLPLLALIGGVAGGGLSFAIQWYANVVAYPLNIGGRPRLPVPAFLVPTFEGTILGAALAGFIGLLLVLRLPALWHPVFEIPGFERATEDRFFLAVPRRNAQVTADTLTRLGAARVMPMAAAP